MAWTGWLSYAGNEILNVSRVEAYVKNSGSQWLRPQFENESLPHMLGDRVYRTPLLDDAPWLDGDIAASEEFYGLYPLDITGLEDSSRTSTVTESLSDGGVPGRLRHATKTVAFNVALLAASEAGAEYGMRWLRKALQGGACGAGVASACNGEELCYLASEPALDIIEDINQTPALLDGGYFSSIPDRLITSEDTDGGVPGSIYDTETWGGPPGVGEDVEWSDGGSVGGEEFGERLIVTDFASEEMILDAGPARTRADFVLDGDDPWWDLQLVDAVGFPFEAEQTLSDDAEECLIPLMRSLRKVLFNSGPSVTAKRTMSDGSRMWTVTFSAVAGSPYEHSAEIPVIEGFMDPKIVVPWVGGEVPDGAAYDLDGFIYSDEFCQEPTFRAIYDPLNPSMIDPPAPPNVPLGNYVPPLNWKRRQISIPKQYVPLWGDVVPKIEVHARTDLRNLRVRFYADPENIGDISEDPCAYCGDIVISYVPASHTLIFDGSEEVVRILAPGGGLHRADSLVFKTDGTPFDWPALTCGYGYVVTFDLPQTQAAPVVDLSLFSRTV